MESKNISILEQDLNSNTAIDYIIALFPAVAGGVMIFGWYTLLQVASCAVAAIVVDTLWSIVFKETLSAANPRALVTGILSGLILPPNAPVWIGCLGSAIAIILIHLFGLINRNLFNPIVAARIILAAAFPSLMAKWTDPCVWMNSVPDAVTSPTPLAEGAEIPSYMSMFLGLRGGSIGETCIMLLLCGGIYLIVRKIISPIIPLSFIGAVAIGGLILGKDPLIWVMSGGVILGSIFIATDFATSPVSKLGNLIYGIGCGLITILIRCFGILPEGVAFAVLIMSALSPLIDILISKIPQKAIAETDGSEVEEQAEENETADVTQAEDAASEDTEPAEESEEKDGEEPEAEEIIEETEDATDESEDEVEEQAEEQKEE